MTLSSASHRYVEEGRSEDGRAASWRARLLPPGDLLSRVRWILLLVCWLVSVPRLVLIWLGPADLSIRLIGCAALLSLCWWWLYGYRTQHFPTRAIPLEGLGLFLTVFSADAITAFSVFYVSLNFRGVYTSRLQAILLWPMYIGAFAGGIAFCQAPLTFSPFSTDAFIRIPGFVFSVGVTCLIGSTLIRHERTLRRERILREVSADLAAIEDCAGATRVALDAALALVAGVPGAEVRLFIGHEGAMETAGVVGATSRATRSAASVPAVSIPLRIGEHTRGALVVEADAPLLQENVRALETLGTGIAMTLERIALAQRLCRLALYDALTGLPNRAHLVERLRQALEAAVGSDRRIAVLYVDLDGFKTVNDTLGHAAGDVLLTEIGHRLETCLRPGDIVARMGGDEFVILLDGNATAIDAQHVATKIVDVARLPVSIGGCDVTVSASVGIAFGAGADATVDGLLHNADLALYEAKTSGRTRSAVFGQAFSRNPVPSRRDALDTHPIPRSYLGVSAPTS